MFRDRTAGYNSTVSRAASVTRCLQNKMRSERAIRKAATAFRRIRTRTVTAFGVLRKESHASGTWRSNPGLTARTQVCAAPTSLEQYIMPQVTMRQMLEAGVHFGHQTRYWNPAHGAVHLRRARQDPHHQSRKDAAAVHGRDELHLGPRAEARHDPVRRHQALGARCDQGRGHPLRHAVRRGALARRHADQLPHGQGLDRSPEGARDDGHRRQLREARQARSAAAGAASARSSKSRSAASRT